MSGGSRSSTSTASSSRTRVSEPNLQDSGGLTLAQNSGPVTLVSNSTSSGAMRVARNAVDANAAEAATGFHTLGDVSAQAIGLGGAGLATGASIANAGMDNAAAAYQSGLSFANQALDTVAGLASAQNAGLAQIAAANSAPPGAQGTSLGKTALIAAAIIAAVVLLK